jgi:type IV pilus assembly protein PilF
MNLLIQRLPLALVVGALLVGAGMAQPAAAADAKKSVKTQLDFGVEMAQRGLWSEALFRFEQAGRQLPGDPRVLNNMAVAYEALGQFEKALEQYQNALKADPNNRDLRRNYSRFVEFYRAFKPDQQSDASLPLPEGDSAAKPPGGGAPEAN